MCIVGVWIVQLHAAGVEEKVIRLQQHTQMDGDPRDGVLLLFLVDSVVSTLSWNTYWLPCHIVW